MNLYLYAEDNPVLFSDPTGLIVGALISRASAFLQGVTLTSQEIGVNGRIIDAALGLASGVTRRGASETIRSVPIPGSTMFTVGDLLGGASAIGGLQTISLARNVALLSGAGATVASVGVVGTVFVGGLAFAGGFSVGQAINDLVLNNRRVFSAGNPLENVIFDTFFAPQVTKGAFGRGR